MVRHSGGFLTLAAIMTLMLFWSNANSETQTTGQAGESDAKAVFEQLKQLQGTWRGEGGVIGAETTPVEHVFSVAAGGSVVVEIMDPEDEREINVYHLVDDELLLMHFCGGANQPVLKLDTSSVKPGIFPFVLVGGTNFDPSVDRHIHTSKLVVVGKAKIESWWTAEKAGMRVMESRFVLEKMM
jgi:hypothetical protein